MIRFDASRVTVTFDPGEPYLWVTDPDGDVARDMERRGTNIQRASRRFVGVHTGRLLSTIRKQVGFHRRSVYVDVLAGGGGVNYHMMHHDGTSPHQIRARSRQALRFVVAGRVVFRQQVWHPGTRGTHYLTRALPYGAR